MSSYTRQQLEEHLKTVDVKADRVLDVGGSQLTIKGRTKSWKVRDYKILDLEEPHECKEKPDIVLDIQERDLYGSIDYRKWLKYFDVIFCMEVSEYWYRPYNALRNISYFMKPNGILYISFHFIYPAHNPVDQDYLRYTPRGVEKLLKETGFKILEMQPRKAMANLYGYYAEEKMRPAKGGYDRHNWIGCLIKCRKI